MFVFSPASAAVLQGKASYPAAEVAQLTEYVRANRLPAQVSQVDLNSYQAISQYSPALVSQYGYNSCGLVAVTQWTLTSSGQGNKPASLTQLSSLMAAVRYHAINADGSPAYRPMTGIQPTELARAVQAAGYKAAAYDRLSLVDLYQALANGKIVVVDLLVQGGSEIPSDNPPTYSHFARVLGIDLIRQVIYIENTLNPAQGSYWTLSLPAFLSAWQFPETQATFQPSRVDPSVVEENVTQWALVITR